MEIWDLGVLMPKGSTLNGYLDSKLCRWLLHQLCLPWLLKFSPVPPPYLSGSVLPQDTVLSPFLGPLFLDSGACLGSASLPQSVSSAPSTRLMWMCQMAEYVGLLQHGDKP